MFQPDPTAAGTPSRDVIRSQPHEGQPHRSQPHEGRRRPRARPSRWQAAALLGGAAAVIVALVLVFSFSGGSGQPVPRLPDTHAAPSGGEQKVEGGAQLPTTPARPVASAAASSPAPAASAPVPRCRAHGMYHRGCTGLSPVPGRPRQ